MDQELKRIIDNSPSAIRNSIVIFIVRILAWIIGSVLFTGGWAFLISGLASGKLMEAIMPEEYIKVAKITQPLWNDISIGVGALALLLGSMLLFMVRLSKMVLRRNAFILDLYNWQFDIEKQERKAAKEAEEKEKMESEKQGN